MPKKDRITAVSASVLFALATFFFLGFRYAYHIHYQEQMQLFQFTTAYFADVVSVPGGFADWCGRFLTQFCYYARTGAALLALLLAGIQILTWKCIGRKDALSYSLSFIPAILSFVYLLDENSIPGAVVSVFLALSLAACVSSVEKGSVRIPVLLVGVPVSYFLCGPLAVIYVLLVPRKEKLPVWAAAIVLAGLCPLAGQYIFAYPFRRLLVGIHYYRYPLVMPMWIWLAAAAGVIVGYAGCFKPFTGRVGAVTGAAVFAASIAAGVFLTANVADFQKEEMMEYDFMLQHRMWNRMMMKADVKNPDMPLSVSCLNMALAQTDRMESNMFDYYQNGPEGLLPGFVRDCSSPIPTGEIYWHLGMVNTAQRFFFEAQEAIPDFQKSARCYRKLAETNIVNRDYEVARKYLEALENTAFYRKWAKNAGRILADSTAIREFPEYVHLRELRFKEHDFLFSDSEMDSMLGLLFVENKSNSLAFKYLISWSLLKKDLDRFEQCFSLVTYLIPPKHYQEAYLLQWVSHHADFNGLPSNIERNNAVRLQKFIKAATEGRDEDYMKKNFGDTYWFYYYYRFK